MEVLPFLYYWCLIGVDQRMVLSVRSLFTPTLLIILPVVKPSESRPRIRLVTADMLNNGE